MDILYNNALDLEIMTGVEAELINGYLVFPANSTLRFSLQIRQFLIQLDSCMTIYKAQGRTLD